MTKVGTATHSQLGRDLYWSLFIPAEGRTLRWIGYDDANWWDNVCPLDQFRNQTGQTGKVYRLDPHLSVVVVLD